MRGSERCYGAVAKNLRDSRVDFSLKERDALSRVKIKTPLVASRSQPEQSPSQCFASTIGVQNRSLRINGISLRGDRQTTEKKVLGLMVHTNLPSWSLFI